MSKLVKYEEQARTPVIEGIDTVANIVKTTVGPKGRNVLIRNNLDLPVITNDGVTIAKSIQLKDNAQDAGAQLIISAANKTNEIAGDGTTTTTILAQAMIHKYYELLKSNGGSDNVVQTQRDMLKASQEISEFLKSIAVPVTDNTMIERVATISSGSEITGKLIADAFAQAGEHGSVIVEDSKTGIDNLISIEGMKIPNGSVHQYLLSDRVKGKSQIFDGQILITQDKLDNVTELIPVLDDIVKNGRNVLIMCDGIEFEPLNMILMNKAKGIPINISIIRIPGFGELREQLLSDLAIATGATVMGRENNLSLRDYSPSYLGVIQEATITMDDTILKFKDMFVPIGSEMSINLSSRRKQRAEELKAQLSNLSPSDNKEALKRRISNLISGISVIQVGGNSEVEIKDKKLRIEDAINSVQSAKEEGIVPGGGFSFLSAVINAGDKLGSLGENVVYKSLESVTTQIAENAGFDGPMTVAECYNQQLGFNALTGKYENLLETGVINSAKVDRYSLLNATSVAATVITMGGLVIEENEKDYNVFQLQGPSPAIM